MKKMYFLMMFIAPLLLTAMSANANERLAEKNFSSADRNSLASNSWVTIGSGTDKDISVPCNFNYKESVSQIIYLASEIKMNGKIDKIVYSYNNEGGKTVTKPLKIYMASTTLTSFSNEWIPQNLFTLVFEGDVNINIGKGELEIPLDTPFKYLSDNLCIMNIRPMDTESFSDVRFIATYTGQNRSRTYGSDSNPFDFIEGRNRTNIPNTKLSIIPKEPVLEGAPAAVTGLTITPGLLGGLSASIAFVSPMVSSIGNPISAIDKIEIFRNDVQIKEFILPNVGSNINYQDNLTESNEYEYTIVATNEVGVGVPLVKSLFIGSDLPLAPTNIRVVKSENNAVITWDAPTAGLKDGWFDVASLEYKITRLPDGCIFDNVKGNTCTDNTITTFGKYSYTIQSKNITGNGGIGNSNVVIVGPPFQIPYTCSLKTLESFDKWTVIDANNDKSTWVYDRIEECTAYEYNTLNNGDDWLISPPLLLQAGRKYVVKFDAKSESESWPESLKVYYGREATVAAQETCLDTYPSLGNKFTTFRTLETINPTVTGDYNISFYAYSEADAMYLYVKNVIVEELADNDLMAVSVTGNTLPMINREQIYTVDIENKGSITQKKYVVQLVDLEDNVLSEKEVSEPILPNERKSIYLKWMPRVTGTVVFKGKVILEIDKILYNNETSNITVECQPQGDEEWTIIGNETELNKTMPVNFIFKTSASQTIYLESELGFSGMIQQVSYNYNNTGKSGFTKPIKLYMASTELSDLSGGWIPKDKMTLVFDGTIVTEIGENELVITLTTPFIYDGGNLCVMGLREMDTEFFFNFDFLVTSTNDVKRSIAFSNNIDEFDWISGVNKNFIANIKILALTGGGGKIEGVVKCNDNTLDAVRVTLNPIGIHTYTNTSGVYLFNNMPEGNYSISASKYGFENKLLSDITVSNGKITTMNIDIVELTKCSVSGTVKDLEGQNVEGASILVTGYENYETITDNNGDFVISNVYKSDNYLIKAVKKGFSTFSTAFNVEAVDVVIPEIVLTDIPIMTSSVIAIVNELNVDITWNEPAAESTIFRYDNDVIGGQLGFTAGSGNRSVIGAVHRTPAVLNNMSWWTLGAESAGGKHETINVFVFDLDNAGQPTSKILFNKMHVPNIDDQWTTFNFKIPVECPNGFMIAISYIGYAGLAIDEGKTSGEWQYIPDGNYYMPDYKTGKYIKIGEDGEYRNNVLIRAEGYLIGMPKRNIKSIANSEITDNIDKSIDNSLIGELFNSYNIKDQSKENNAKSILGYKVWRLLESNQQESESSWTLLTPSVITEKAFSDNNWSSVANGTYKYAVKSLYCNDLISAPSFSNMVPKGMTSVVTLTVNTNTTPIESKGAVVTLTNNDNNSTHIYSGVVEENGQIVMNVWKGIYKIDIKLPGFNILKSTDIDLNSDKSLEYTLTEICVNPFNLEIINAANESERIFRWNVSNTVNDDFERHPDFKINSAGEMDWSYIDADGSITYGFENATFANAESEMAYIIFNPNKTSPVADDERLLAHSGDKFLASFAAQTSENKDFFISPKLLFATEFTFSFWAKTYLPEFGLERMKVGYSTTGNAQADFINWLTPGNYVEVNKEWTKYNYNIPANARYVTIECVSNDAFIFMIDDVFIGIEPKRALTNYEVYLDNTKIGETSNNSYELTNLKSGKHTAGVKTIYTSGSTTMSEISFDVLVGVKDMNNLTLNIYPNPVENILNIEGECQWFEIYDMTGTIIFECENQESAKQLSRMQVDVSNWPHGVYIIKAYDNDSTSTYKIVK